MPTEENKCLFSLNCADDQNAGDLEFILNPLNKAYKEWGLTIYFKHTEFIAINRSEFHVNIEASSKL